MSNLAAGNILGGLDTSSRNSLSIPGYQICKATGYIALKTTPYNRFPVIEPTGKFDGIDRLLTVPMGARIYSIALRTGGGFFNRIQSNPHLTLVDPQGVINPIITQNLGVARNSDAQNFGAGLPLNPQKHPTGRLENKVLAGYPSNDNDTVSFAIDPFAVASPGGTDFADAINAYLYNSQNIGVTPEKAAAQPGPSFEIQCRIGPNPNDILSNLLTGGFMQNPKPEYKNLGYAIVDIGYIVKDWSVSGPEDLSVKWDEVFKYVF